MGEIRPRFNDSHAPVIKSSS
jgi:G2/mitotic-specific cyclin-B, other